jgi:hypothetical protein
MVEVTLLELAQAEEVFRRIANQPMKAAASFKVSKVIKAIANEMKIADEERYKLIEKYGEHDENGQLRKDDSTNTFPIKEECKMDFMKESNDLFSTVSKIQIDKLDGHILEDMTLTPLDILKIEPFFEL